MIRFDVFHVIKLYFEAEVPELSSHDKRVVGFVIGDTVEAYVSSFELSICKTVSLAVVHLGLRKLTKIPHLDYAPRFQINQISEVSEELISKGIVGQINTISHIIDNFKFIKAAQWFSILLDCLNLIRHFPFINICEKDMVATVCSYKLILLRIKIISMSDAPSLLHSTLQRHVNYFIEGGKVVLIKVPSQNLLFLICELV